MNPPTELERRVAAAQATMRAFQGRPFEWGKTDCARLAAHVVRELGHPTPLARFGAYSTALGARRALKRRGFSDLGAVLDDMGFARVPPAFALPCDLVGLVSDDLPVALTVALGNGRIFGFHPQVEGAAVLQPNRSDQYVAAWRVI